MKTALCALVILLVVSTCQAEKIHTLMQIFKMLKPFINNAKHNETYFYSPTSDIQECCSLSALECFNSQLLNIPTYNKEMQMKLHKKLRKSSVVSSVNTCKQEQKEKAQCRSCTSYPMVDSKDFLNNLQLLLQKTFNRLLSAPVVE